MSCRADPAEDRVDQIFGVDAVGLGSIGIGAMREDDVAEYRSGHQFEDSGGIGGLRQFTSSLGSMNDEARCDQSAPVESVDHVSEKIGVHPRIEGDPQTDQTCCPSVTLQKLHCEFDEIRPQRAEVDRRREWTPGFQRIDDQGPLRFPATIERGPTDRGAAGNGVECEAGPPFFPVHLEHRVVDAVFQMWIARTSSSALGFVGHPRIVAPGGIADNLCL